MVLGLITFCSYKQQSFKLYPKRFNLFFFTIFPSSKLNHPLTKWTQREKERYLKSALVRLELSEAINGVEDVTSVNGEAITHPALESRPNWVASRQLLDSVRQAASGFFLFWVWDLIGNSVWCLGAEEKVEGGWDFGGRQIEHTKCSRFCLNQTPLYHKVQPLHA